MSSTMYAMMAPDGKWISNVFEVSEDWAWIRFLKLKRMPSKLTHRDLQSITYCKTKGFRVVAVNAVPGSI